MGKDKRYVSGKTVAVVLPPELYEKMRQLAKEEDRSMSSVVRLALQQYFREREMPNDER